MSYPQMTQMDADRVWRGFGMRRVMVMGPPGAGKSTLARRLAARLGVPVFHLDQAFHSPGWVRAPEGVFRAEVERIAALPAWVIDGNYTAFAAARLAAADTIVYLDVAAWVCVVRVLRRMIGSYGRVRMDGPAGCPERFSLEFLRYAWSNNREKRAAALALVEGFGGRQIVLRGKREQERFLVLSQGNQKPQ